MKAASSPTRPIGEGRPKGQVIRCVCNRIPARLGNYPGVAADQWILPRLPPILRNTSLHACDLNSNVLEDEAANFFLEVWVVAELSGWGREAVFACHFRQIFILTVGRKDHLAIDLLRPSTALDGVAGARKDKHGANSYERHQHQSWPFRHQLLRADYCESDGVVGAGISRPHLISVARSRCSRPDQVGGALGERHEGLGAPKLKADAEAARYSGHSLRVGFAVAAAEAGADIRAIASVTRHRSLAMPARYAQKAEQIKTSIASLRFGNKIREPM